jgi:hypothetical protein
MNNLTTPSILKVWHKVRTKFGKGKIIDISRGIYKILLADWNIYDKAKWGISHIKAPSEKDYLKRLEKAKIKSIDYEWYKLPDQNRLGYTLLYTEKTNEDWYVVFSQTDQNQSDSLQYALVRDYAEDIYTIKQNDKEYKFIGTFAVHIGDITWQKNTTNLSMEDYFRQFPDAIFLWVWQYNSTSPIE